MDLRDQNRSTAALTRTLPIHGTIIMILYYTVSFRRRRRTRPRRVGNKFSIPSTASHLVGGKGGGEGEGVS